MTQVTTLGVMATCCPCLQVPNLSETLKADTTDVLNGIAKHDMAEAIEHVVCGIADMKSDMREAFSARDRGNTGALGGCDFKVEDVSSSCFSVAYHN